MDFASGVENRVGRGKSWRGYEGLSVAQRLAGIWMGCGEDVDSMAVEAFPSSPAAVWKTEVIGSRVGLWDRK